MFIIPLVFELIKWVVAISILVAIIYFVKKSREGFSTNYQPYENSPKICPPEWYTPQSYNKDQWVTNNVPDRGQVEGLWYH